MKSRCRWSRSLVPALAIVLSCCATGSTIESKPPISGVQEDVASPRTVFAPAPSVQATIPPPPAPAARPSNAPPRIGIAGIAQGADTQGNARHGRDFAFDNCRPCHIVAPNQESARRFATGPDFQSVANTRSITRFSLIVWLTNPHPTMPSLVLSPQEAADVIAYIESLRTAP